jgi:cysteine desulfurase/selenocysteine lyase
MSFDVQQIRKQFPILSRKIHGHSLAYLDSAATALKPTSVTEATRQHYEWETSNIHRGVHFLSEKATLAFEKVRERMRVYLGARAVEEIIFTSGATHAINLVAQGMAGTLLQAGDEIILTELEHHSNIVPWQMAAQRIGATIKVIPMNDQGELMLGELQQLITAKTKLIAFTHMANAIGTINDVAAIIDLARSRGIMTLIDGAQAISSTRVNVSELGCDFYVFSAHKFYGPTGIGVLYGKKGLLEQLSPPSGGGGMIRRVTFSGTTYAGLPMRLEPGTPNIAGVIGLGAALDFIESLDFAAAQTYLYELADYALQRIAALSDVRIIGTAKKRGPIISFTVTGVHPHDVGTLIDQKGVAVRVGHHCAQPIMDHFGLSATTRASLGFYNTKEDIDMLCRSIVDVQEVFR